MRVLILGCFCAIWSLVFLQGACGPGGQTDAPASDGATKDAGTQDKAPADTKQPKPDDRPQDRPTPGDAPAKDAGGADEPVGKDEPAADKPPAPQKDYIRKSGTTAKSEDQKWFAVANRDSGSVTVYQLGDALNLKTATKYELKLGSASSEVSSIAMGHDDSYLLATLQYEQKLCRIDLAAGTQQTPKCVKTGSEPVGVVASWDGARIYVTNMVDGTVQIFDKGLNKIYTWDFSNPDTGETQVHPFALLYVKKKDAEPHVYVSDFFAEKIPGKQEGDDDSRQGVVYKVPAASNSLTGQVKIALPPLADTGFRIPDDQGHCKDDPKKEKAGCKNDPKGSGAFPNQLASLSYHQGRIFVLSTCASPRGDVRFNMNVHSCIHAIDPKTDKEIAALRMNIQERIKQQSGAKQFCTVPLDLACVKDSAFCYVACGSSDLVMRLDFKDFSDAKKVIAGVPGTNFLPTGKFPTGLNIFQDASQVLAFVYNENSRNVTVLQLKDQKSDGQVDAAALPTDAKEKELLKGKDFFYTARGRWSDGRWSSCVACHWRGLTDNVTWHFPTGPRQTVSMDGSFSKQNVTPNAWGGKHDYLQVVKALKAQKSFPQRLFNWTTVRDEVADFELNTRGVSGGLGAIVDKDNKRIDIATFGGASNANNNGSTLALVKSLLSKGGIDDWVAITEFAKTIRSPRAKTNVAGDVAAGKKLYETTYGCVHCHAGGAWTLSRRYYDPDLNGVKVSVPLKSRYLAAFAKGKNPKILALSSLLDDNSTCATDKDCNGAANACDFNAKKCQIPMLGNEFVFSLNRPIDQHACVMRKVGTFEKTDQAKGGLELRKNMAAIGQGAFGYNIPSLLNLQLGAPYLHNGQYESLNDFLRNDSTHRILIDKVAGMSAQQAKDLFAYLLTIDGAKAAHSIDDKDQLCPTTFP